jgi:hypothetical protein
MRTFALAGATLALTSAAPAAETLTYLYDARGRLVHVARAGSVNNGVNTAYTFDKANNRLSRTTGTGPLPPPPPPPPASSPPSFSIADTSAAEGDALVFTVTKTGGTDSTYDVDYASAAGTAQSPSDFAPVSGKLTFAPSQTSLTISVSSLEDAVPEGDETMSIALSNANGGGSITDGAATGTILNDDGSNQAPVTQPDSGTAQICTGGAYVNVVANDSDPDGHNPLSLVSIQSVSFGHAWVESETHVGFSSSGQNGTASIVYVVKDSFGATATGVLSATFTGDPPCQ